MEIETDTIAEAHEKVVTKIMKMCREIDIETSPGKWEKTWEYPDLVTVIIRNPWKEPQVSTACNFGPGFIAQYKSDMTHLKLRSEYVNGYEPVYTYPWRLFDFPTPSTAYGLRNQIVGYRMEGNGDGKGINQIDQIVTRILKNPDSRRGVARVWEPEIDGYAFTWVPEIDGNATHDQPCLQVAHFLLREAEPEYRREHKIKEGMRVFLLHLRCFFRSHDMLGGASANWVGLEGLQEIVIQKLVDGGFPFPIFVGSLTTCSSSAHLYWKRDKKDLDDFKAEMFKKYRMFIEVE